MSCAVVTVMQVFSASASGPSYVTGVAIQEKIVWRCWPALVGWNFSPVRVPSMFPRSSSFLCLPAHYCVSV